MNNILSSLNQAATQNSSFYILFLSFVSGILISFTPCVYPMIPITAGILQTQATKSLWHNFLAALFYVLGLATVYASLGVLAASTSMIFGKWTSNPFFILFIIILFLYLAFSLFGFYEIKIPQFLTQTSDNKINGSFIKCFLFGFFSGAIASPCITPALAVLLALVADKGSPILGFFALFFFALGMGSLLILIGTFSTLLNVMPGSGLWMLEIKKIMGFAMIAMCIHFAKPLISENLSKIFYLTVGLIFLGYIVFILIKFLKKTLDIFRN